MNEEEKKQQELSAEAGAAAGAEVGAEAGAEAGSEMASVAPEPTPGESFRNEYAGKYPEEDLSEDDKYYDHLRGKLKERDDYEGLVSNLTGAIKNSPVMAQMLAEAGKEHTDEEGNPIPFDPIVYAVESGQIDWDALGSDPEYGKKIAEAQKKSLATLSKQKELDDEGAKNLQPSIDAINACAEEMGHGEDQKKAVIELAYQIMGDLIVNKITPETYKLLAAGINHDTDVEQARQEGQTQGLATKVSDKLRTLPDRPNRVGGRQKPAQEQQEEEKKGNMFGM